VLGNKDLISPHYVKALFDLGFGAVVSPNYRLSPTISAYNGAVTDSMDAYEWTRSELPGLLSKEKNVILDPGRIVSLGHSAGGTLALLTVGLSNPLRMTFPVNQGK
jgi:acetyl esterase/lipase